MKNRYLLIAICCLFSGCIHFTGKERNELTNYQQIDAERKLNLAANWQKPKKIYKAVLFNALPGVGDFYMCDKDTDLCILGVVGLLTWPVSILWAMPLAPISANAVNNRDLLALYREFFEKENWEKQKRQFTTRQ